MVLQTDNVLQSLKDREYEHESELTATTPKAVYIQSTVEKLDYPLIPFFVLKQDPIAMIGRYLKEKYALEEEYERGYKLSEEQLYDVWNNVFAELQPEQQYFLYAWASVPRISSAILRTMGLVFVIATPGPLYTRWLTTRPVWYEGTVVAWCVPVDMRHKGQERIERILLTEENMLRFTAPALWLSQMQKLEETWESTEPWFRQCPVDNTMV